MSEKVEVSKKEQKFKKTEQDDEFVDVKDKENEEGEEGVSKIEDVGEDTLEFLTKDVTKAYLIVIGLLTILVFGGTLDSRSYASTIKWVSTAFFLQFISNGELIKRVM